MQVEPALRMIRASGDDESVFIPTDDYGFELYWFDGDEDLDFLFVSVNAMLLQSTGR
ncbi:MAG: hypothetical protein R2867_25425 [Caldilineaceae bacterium]